MSRNDPSDETLAARAKRGEAPAMEELARRFLPTVYSVSLQILRNPADAEDACQETFGRLLSEIGKYREDLPFTPWIVTMSTRVAYNWSRSRRRRTEREARYGNEPRPDERTRIEDGDPDERKRLARILDSLPAKYGLALRYKFHQGLDNRQIAELLDVQADSVRVLLFRALSLVRQQMGWTDKRV